MTTGEALNLVDEPVSDAAGERVGRVDAVLVDREDGTPRWLMLRLAGAPGRTAVPLAAGQRGAGHVDLPWRAQDVLAAPRVPADGALTAKAERELCVYFGVDPTPGALQSRWERRRTTARALRADGGYSWEPRPRHEWRAS